MGPHRSLLLRLPQNSGIHLGEEGVWRHQQLELLEPQWGRGAQREAGNLGMRELAPARALLVPWEERLCLRGEATNGPTPLASLNNDASLQCFLHEHSRLWISSLLSPQTISLQLTRVLSPGFISKCQVPAPNPCLPCRSHSVLPAPDCCSAFL